MHHTNTPRQRRDGGFTLVELLIVIVVLGILATVTVFAVRGITERGQENSEGSDLGTLETAIDAYWMEEGSNPSEQDLVDAGYLKQLSSMHEINVAGDGSYTITNARTGAQVGSGVAGSTPAAPTGSSISGTPVTFAGVPGHAVGSGSTVIWIGGANTRAIWNAAVDANRPVRMTGGAERLVFIDSSQIGGLSDLAALATGEGTNYAMIWVVDADDAPGFCQIPQEFAEPLSLSISECLNQGRMDTGGGFVQNTVWGIDEIDTLFDAAG